MAIAGAFGGIASRMLQRRRPLAPLAVSRADGTTSAVPAPRQSRVPQGTIFQRLQQMRGSVPSRSMIQRLQQRAPTGAAAPAAAAPAAQPAPPASPLASATLPTTRYDPATQGPLGGAGPVPQDVRGAIQPGQFRTMDFRAAPPPAQAAAGGQPGQFGANIQDITGEERPQAIQPGQSVTQPLQERAQAEAMRALENPSPYDDELFKQEVERGREALGGDIAERGLDYSTIAPQLFSSRVLQPLLSERARGISEARQRASETARGVIGQRTGLEAEGRGELRGERGYVDELRERARRNEIERYQLGEGQFQQTLQQALASGDPSRALAALQGAGYGLAGPASAYGEQAEQSGAGLQELAQSFIEQFYGNRGT